MKILFYDTETCGLPKNYRAPSSDLENWPRMIQIAWTQYNTETEKFAVFDYMIKPEGFTIPEESTKIHGISTEKALKEGHSLKAVCEVIGKRVCEADLIVGHNISFDRKILGAEFIRCGMPDYLSGTNRLCTMFKSMSYCGIRGRRGLKWPKLQELHKKLFGEEFEDAHDAKADILATQRCFFELVKLGVIKLEVGK